MANGFDDGKTILKATGDAPKCHGNYVGPMENTCFSYQHYGYEGRPLFFMVLPLSREESIGLMQAFDTWYGDTGQDTDIYALELLLIMQCLLNDSAVILNPKHLLLEEVLDGVCDKIPDVCRRAYRENVFHAAQGELQLKDWLN